ncbi:Bacterial extracellular solute-binding protein, family 3 [Synechococcus sp. PCC 7335]|uniref:transporter substrate-binding domain-containing protein n=1 Tax=Synechococcus sp. (strain ATCC 29403 / PCC 7335) TaxID=91464 RepID=UPI00017EBFD3|nr:transporter substrate-binding domain-containing protein [Synechococcus sp. PCC 7335]EDX84388.1 Bacterial extracellular solute-binding protein, family 3 [Synechococcus sp. PCC 7335]
MRRKLLAGVGSILGVQFLLPLFVSLNAFAAELSEIRERGYLVVAVKDNRPPMGFLNSADQLSGFEIDIARKLAEDLLGDADAVELVPTRNVDRLDAVIENRVDVAIAALTITEPRRRIVSFSYPYYLDGTAFITRLPTDSAPDILTLHDLQLGTIAVLERSSTVAQLSYLLPAAQQVGVGSYLEAQTLVESGAVDAFAGDASVLAGWTMEGGALMNHSMLPDIISAEPLAVVLPKGQQYSPLQTAVNKAIQRWYKEGWLQARSQFWELPEGVVPEGVLPSALDAEGTR